ncbi:thiol reductant ABC exporter subunit CydC [Acidocella aromatica]|uniref:ATP-binding cassette subfamily C protein CydC n=1 Tax=Acidocella aromatica TaxID=1303579 RepID=A0A840VGG8_9PROT|nr:thiol reductant ABC exporter subunit CydC [Acidocella aromatica]MBB5372295.1 ATP-binding cassette subfamily C protein CydC [Acidocella aromatica]
MSPMRRILSLWLRDAGWLALAVLLSLAALAAGVALMGFSGRYLALSLAGTAVLVPLGLQFIGSVRVVLRYMERVVSHEAIFRALADLRVWLFRGLAASAAGGLGFRRAGDALSRLVNDVDALDGLFLRIFVPGMSALMLVPVLAWVLWREHAAAALVLLPFLYVAFYLPVLAARAARENAGKAGQAMSGLRSAALDALHGLREVKIFEAEGRMLAAVQSREAALLAAQRELVAKGSALNARAFILAQGGILLAILLGFLGAPVAAIIAVMVLTTAFETVLGLPRAGLLYGQANAAAMRVVQAAEAPPAVPDPATPSPMPSRNSIAFEHVSFRYGLDRPWVFENLSLQVPQGARVAILGPSGAGKSTIAALLLKLVAPVSGQIRLGGTDVLLLPSEELRHRIAYLGQTSQLFADTIRNNLLLGDPAADDARLWAALEDAQVADVVRALPEGLDAWVGEGGATLSGGQGRRLALARTLLMDAPILVLDEPCAGLDAATEQEFFKVLNNVTEGRTVLLILHRLTGVEQLDRIWRLTGGALISAAG